MGYALVETVTFVLKQGLNMISSLPPYDTILLAMAYVSHRQLKINCFLIIHILFNFLDQSAMRNSHLSGQVYKKFQIKK